LTLNPYEIHFNSPEVTKFWRGKVSTQGGKMSIQNTIKDKVYFLGPNVNIKYFGGVNVSFLNIVVKSVNRWIVFGVKCIFPLYLCDAS
jgi:hypothetical protein